MKTLRVSLTVLLSLCLTVIVNANWGFHSLGGGNVEKMIVVDNSDPSVHGVMFFDKDGGTHWLPWNTGSSTWGDWQDLDANYCWHMGGDVVEINDTLNAIAVTMQRHHIYKYYNNQWNQALPEQGIVENSYYNYHDAQFVADTSGNYNISRFLVSTWQIAGFPPYNTTYRQGIFLVTDGNAPIVNANPISGTSGYVFPKIYRDPDDGMKFYTWYKDEEENEAYLCKVTVTYSSGQYSATLSTTNEFNMTGYTLKGIAGFYQYSESNGIDHQYLLAFANDGYSDHYYVWHRERASGGSFSNNNWSSKWSEIETSGNLGTNPEQVVAYEYNSQNDYHYIYVTAQKKGLAFHDSNDDEYNILTNDGTDYFQGLDLHAMVKVPWSHYASNHDQLVVGIAHKGVYALEFNYSSGNISLNKRLLKNDFHCFIKE